MLKEFQFEPFVGALPIAFGMTTDVVEKVLGPPTSRFPSDNGSLRMQYWDDDGECGFMVHFDATQQVKEVCFGSGMSLMFQNRNLLDLRDLIPFLTTIDAKPFESVGVVVFREIGLSMEVVFDPRFRHPGDPDGKYFEDRWNQRSVNCFRRGVFEGPEHEDLKPYSSH